MANAFNPDVPFVADGEPVDASTTNRPSRVQAQNAQYLKDRVDAAELGEAVVAYGVTIDPSLLAGQPAGYDPSALQFVPALGELVSDGHGVLVSSPRSQCVGLLVAKTSATLGNLLIGGRYPIDLTPAAGPDPAPGLYYLSNSTPGGLTLQKQPLAAPVLFYDGTYAYFSPTLRDFAHSHEHFAFDLACTPAGNNVVFNGRHTIPAPDATLPGWLPAAHASFLGLAPTGAVFGYNLAADHALSAIWPPVPPGSLNLWWDKGDGTELGGQLLRGGADATDIAGLWYADRTTLWWLSDVLGDVPWPAAYTPGTNPGPLPHTTVPPANPRPTRMRLVASFTEMLFETAKSTVTSLAPAAGSPITVLDCDGNPATTGALQLNLDLGFLVSPTPVAGASVLKTLTGSTFAAGNVVEKLVAGANVTLTPTIGDGTGAQGTVAISVATDLAGRELSPEVTRLGEAKERSLGDVMYLGFPSGRASAIRMRFDVPSTGLPPSPLVAIRVLVYGLTTGTLPATTMAYRILPRPASGAAVTPATSDTSVAFNSNLDVVGGQYLECTSTPVAVTAGDTLFVTLARGASDGYSGEVGVIRVAGVVLAGP